MSNYIILLNVMDLFSGVIILALMLIIAGWYGLLPYKLNIETHSNSNTSGFRTHQNHRTSRNYADGFESSHTMLSSPIFYSNVLAKQPAVKSMHDLETDKDSFRRNVPRTLKDKMKHTDMRWRSDSQVNDGNEDYNHKTRKREYGNGLDGMSSTDQIIFNNTEEKLSQYDYAISTDSNYINKLMNTNIKIPEEVVTPNLNDFAVSGDTCKSVSGAVLTLTDYSPAFNDVQYGTGKGYISI